MYQTMQAPILRPDLACYTDIVYANVFNDWRRLPELTYYAYHGWAVANVQYRTSTQGVWPAQILDLKAAIRFLKVHADQFGIDPDRITVGGESAGAHLAALAAVTGKTDLFRTCEWDTVSDEVQGAICWYCPGDLTFLRQDQESQQIPVPPLDLLLNCNAQLHPDKVAELSPSSYVRPDAPPFLFLHGDQDNVVKPACALSLHDKLTQNGVSSEFYMIEGATHASAHFAQAPVQELMLRFMDDTIGRAQS